MTTTRSRARELRVVDADDSEVLDLTLIQGSWTEEQYLTITDSTSRLLEFDNGVIEVLPMPTPEHQKILALLYELFVAFVRPRGGIVLFSPLRVLVRPHKYREPDLVVLRDKDDPRQNERYWTGVDLALEVVSPKGPKRDTKLKRAEYARAGIPEYWIVNPLDDTVTVLVLEGDIYSELGVFRRGERAVSRLFEGFEVSVDAVFDAR